MAYLSNDHEDCPNQHENSHKLCNAPFHRIAYDYSCAYWDSLCGHLRDSPWENAFKLIASAAASEFL